MYKQTKKLSLIGLSISLSIVLVYFIRFPIFPIAPFLEYDPADIPIFILTFLFNFKYGLYATLLVSIIQGFTVSASSGIIGILMHIFATGTYVIVFGILSKKMKNLYLSCTICTLCMTLSMVIWNIVFTPFFLGTPISAVLSIMVPAIIPFNIIKAGLNSIISIFIYKSLKNKIKAIK
ncbi:MAG: ECF transporter S component [Oscillospiraceae bacterium]